MPEIWRWHPQTLSEMLEFETDIRQPPGGEWRDSLKDATQYLYLSHVLSSVESEKLVETVRLNAFGEWYVPEWPNASKLMTTLASGATSIAVPLPEVYSVGQKVFVSTDNDHYEIAQVASLGVGIVNLTAGLSATYGGNSVRPVVVAPVVLCVAPGGVETQSVFPSQSVSVSFMSIEPVDLADNEFDAFDGLPVLNDVSVPFSPLAGSMNQAIDVMPSRFGAYEFQEVETFTRRRATLSFMDKGLSAMWKRRKLIHLLRGRDGEFWLPTGQNDLHLQASIDAGDLSILVKGITTNAAMVGKFIMIKEGPLAVYKEIMAATTVGPNQELEITAPGVAFTTSASVSLMVRSRLDTDQIALDYQFVAGGLASFGTLPAVEVP